MRKSAKLFLAVVAMLSLTVSLMAAGVDELRVGAVYIGPARDGGWTQAHDDGIESLRDLPYVKNIMKKEEVPESSEATKAMTQMIKLGKCNLIFATSFGYMDQAMGVAEDNPNVVIMHCSGYKTAKNMGTYYGKIYQAKFLGGMVAGMMTKSNKIGYVAPIAIPEIYRLVDAFALGVKSVNKDAKVQVVWVGSWFDPAKEMDAAKSMIEQGCDVITQGGDSPAPQQAAEKAGVWAIGHDNDMSAYAPTKSLTSVVWHWGVIYKMVAEAVHKGTWKAQGPSEFWPDISTGVAGLTPFTKNVPKKVQKKVEAMKAKIISGEYKIFEGPIKDQDGKLRVKKGQTMKPQELLSMDWLVDNVVGNKK